MGKSGKRVILYCTNPGCPKTAKYRPCPFCGVRRRCKDHCDCKGTENAKGRRASRPAKKDRPICQVARAAPAPQQVPMILSAAGRPPSLGVDVFADSSWLDHALQEMKGAKHVVLASYVYNNDKVQRLLTQRLKGRSEFQCIVAVDRSAYEKNVAPGEKAKLKELKESGVAKESGDARITILLCDGQRGSGIFHWKCIIIDGKIVFSGSANVTQGCLNNWELVFRLVGHPVNAIKDGLEEALQRSTRF